MKIKFGYFKLEEIRLELQSMYNDVTRIGKIHKWLIKLKIKMNIEKTQAIMIGRNAADERIWKRNMHKKMPNEILVKRLPVQADTPDERMYSWKTPETYIASTGN